MGKYHLSNNDRIRIAANKQQPNSLTIGVRTGCEIILTPVVITMHDGFMTITRAAMSGTKKTYSLNRISSGWYQTLLKKNNINEYEIPLGIFDIDKEDSTEDELIIYF